MPAATSEGGEEAEIKDAEWLELLCHNIVYSTCNLNTPENTNMQD